MYHGFDLSPGSDHSLCFHDPQNIFFLIFRHFVKIKIIKTISEDLPLLDHHIPVETALHDFHHQKLKLLLIVMHRNAPFLIMVADHFFIAHTPGAPLHIFLLTDHFRSHLIRYSFSSVLSSVVLSMI